MKSPGGSVGPVVTRRAVTQNSLAPPGSDKKKPGIKATIRSTIESMVSTDSTVEYFKPNQTIIIFDWDDTLCPSSWICANKRALSFFKPAPNIEKFQKPLKELQARVEALLQAAMKLGSVIIVTNAMDPWVETSCKNFLPQLLPLVKSLPIIYARSIFEIHSLDSPHRRRSSPGALGTSSASKGNLPGIYAANGQNRLGNQARLASQAQRFDELAPQRWKEVAFEKEIDTFYSRYQHQSWKNIISIGDSIFERDAVRNVVLARPSQEKKCRTKTLKLFDDPSIEELVAQVAVVSEVLNMMVHYDGELAIEIDEQDLEAQFVAIP